MSLATRIVRAFQQFAQALRKEPEPVCDCCDCADLTISAISECNCAGADVTISGIEVHDVFDEVVKPTCGLPSVEIHAAYYWTCENCGTDNFGAALNREFAPGEKEKFYRDSHEMEDWEELPDGWESYRYAMVPEYVKCKACCENFRLIAGY